mgnify:CR=1 FL=1
MAGCAGSQSARDEQITNDVDQSVRDAEARAQYSRTLSSLAHIEESLAAYVKAEGNIPETLDQLVPRYLADIPSAELSVRGHSDNARVQKYPSAVLRDGQIDGSQLRDTGRWGYVHNDRQVVLFVDCTHPSRGGRPWYQEKGVY